MLLTKELFGGKKNAMLNPVWFLSVYLTPRFFSFVTSKVAGACVASTIRCLVVCLLNICRTKNNDVNAFSGIKLSWNGNEASQM